MSDQGCFLLGLGAQKSGSTWVHSYLAADSNADFGPIKEYHVWDSVHLPEMAHYDHRGRSGLRNAGESLLRRALRRSPSVSAVRGALQDDLEGYFDFFKDLLNRPGIALTGDITPAYAGLPASVLETIRDGFAHRGIPMKAMFLMRDPVTRCVSAAQMNRRKSTRTEAVQLDGDLDTAVLAYAQSPEARLRADYERTVTALRQVFAEDQLFFGFYETIFQRDEIARLSEFAGVASCPEHAERQVNVHAKAEYVGDATQEQLRIIFDPTYKFCAEIYPETKDIWMPEVLNPETLVKTAS